MDIYPDEAVSLLQKWRDESRLIHGYIIISQKTNSCIIGRIEELTPVSVRVGACSLLHSGFQTGLLLDLSEATSFGFEDWRFASGSEVEEQIRQVYEGFLFVRFASFEAQLWAVKTTDEINAPS
jgi:hypothetical protein